MPAIEKKLARVLNLGKVTTIRPLSLRVIFGNEEHFQVRCNFAEGELVDGQFVQRAEGVLECQGSELSAAQRAAVVNMMAKLMEARESKINGD